MFWGAVCPGTDALTSLRVRDVMRVAGAGACSRCPGPGQLGAGLRAAGGVGAPQSPPAAREMRLWCGASRSWGLLQSWEADGSVCVEQSSWHFWAVTVHFHS